MTGGTESPSATVAIRLDATDTDVEDPSSVARLLPLPATLPVGARVTVHAVAAGRGGLFRRLLGERKIPVSRATRCTALLVRGYVAVAADDAIAWGFVPGPD